MTKPSRNATGVHSGVRSRRQGTVVVLLLFLLPLLVLCCGFAIDAAHMYGTKTEMKAVADLVAKATADVLSDAQDTQLAIAAGQALAARNTIAGTPVTLQASDFDFGRSTRQPDGRWAFTSGATPYNSVRVNIARKAGSSDGGVPLYLGRLYGRPLFEPEVASTASVIDVDVCLVLDRSSSMKKSTTDTTVGLLSTDPRACDPPYADSRWAALSTAVGVFVAELNANSSNKRVGVVTFGSDDGSLCGEINTNSSIDLALTSNINLVNNAMAIRNSTVWNGNTNIDAGIVEAHNHLNASGRPYSFRVIILLTDGKFTGADPLPAAQAANGDGIMIHTITFGDTANQTDMQAVASAASGQHHHAPDAAALQTVFRELAGSFSILTE